MTLTTGAGAAVVLAAARAWACLRVQASWRAAVGGSWEWIAAALAVALAGFAAVSGRLDPVSLASPVGPVELETHALALDGPWLGLAVAAVFELGLGTVVGLAISLPGWALVGAADTTEAELGVRGPSSGPLARVLVLGSLSAGLSLGLHAPILAGLLGLFDDFAVGQPQLWLPQLAALPSWLGARVMEITALALALATPVLLASTLVSLCVASGGRGRGELGPLVGVVEPGLRLGAALVALGAAWSTYPEAFARGL